MQYSIAFCLQTIEQYIAGSFSLQMLILSSRDLAYKVRHYLVDGHLLTVTLVNWKVILFWTLYK
jgi:hypothetical protein